MDVAVTYSLIREYFLLQCVAYPIAHNIWNVNSFPIVLLFSFFCCSSSTDIVVLRA